MQTGKWLSYGRAAKLKNFVTPHANVKYKKL